MTDAMILSKAIEKAEAKGFDITLVGDVQPYEDYRDAKYIIFSHFFAIAIWGEEYVDIYGHTEGEYRESRDFMEKFNKSNYREVGAPWHPYLESWQYHLQQMVLEKEPLKYLEQFL